MKGKIFIIASLLLLLAFTVYKMLEYEESVREERVITEFIEDESRPLFEKLEEEELRKISQTADYYFWAEGDYFKHLHYVNQKQAIDWEDILFKGVNLGVALPGKFPAEFSMSYEEYLEWFTLIGRMNANVVRTYTILPPEFYEAFAQYNLLHQDRPLYLMHGVWATVPEDHNYLNKDYSLGLQKEIVDVLDVIHGNAVIPARRGKASGVYATDVSEYVAAVLFGREWEPDGVYKTNRENKVTHYKGDFVSVHDGSAMEVWLAKMMDFVVLYETQAYHMQHPVSFVNWLPLDPMYHHTEIIENNKVREFDNDLEGVDFNHFHNTALFIPGLFASYHAYPYYPDFVYLESRYAEYQNEDGQPDNFAGYLDHLKEHHRGMPLIISEYGVPSSRGNSHITPLGFDQGGHSESEHARINLTLTKDIFNTGCAGALFFEWADEWFKHNWLVMDFEAPFEDRKLWHNLENPEQNFGILAMESRKKNMDGLLDDWNPNDFSNGEYPCGFHADPAYFYLAFQLDDFNISDHNFFIALDVIGGDKGDHKLPFSPDYYDNGFEFLLEFISTDSARILVDESYSVFTDIYNDSIPGYASVENQNGKYVEQVLLSNRGRKTLLGEKFDSVLFNRSRLVHGNTGHPEFSNADWFWNDSTKTIEIRLTWHLLNVTDPAKRFVLDDKKGTPEIEYAKSESFQLFGFITDADNNLLKQIPGEDPTTYTWTEWDEPEYQSRLKPVYDSLRNYFRAVNYPVIRPEKEQEVKNGLSICPFYQDKQGAVSFSFDNAAYSQYELALPVLQKYDVTACFGIIPEYLDESPGMHLTDGAGRVKRLSRKEVEEMQAGGHTVAFQSLGEGRGVVAQLADLKSRVNGNIRIRHSGQKELLVQNPSYFAFQRGISDQPGSVTGNNGVNYSALYTSDVTMPELDRILEQNKTAWTILVYTYLSGKEELNTEKGETRDGYFIPQSRFERQVRLARNKDFWLASEWDAFRYLKERQASELVVSHHKDLVFITIENKLDKNIYNYPLTICYRTEAPFVEISGSMDDGVYKNRDGKIIFNALPGKEVTVRTSAN